jgi:glutaredoxin-like protein NrdH
MAITVYTKSACVQCQATRRSLDKAGLAYATVDLDADAEALAQVVALGYRQAPVVMAGGDHWSGYRPDRIAALADRAAQGGGPAADTGDATEAGPAVVASAELALA